MQQNRVSETLRAAAIRWLASGPGLRVTLACALLATGLIAFTAYESIALGWPVVREEPASFDLYHLARSAFAFTGCLLLIGAIWPAQSASAELRRKNLPGPSAFFSILTMAGALVLVALMVTDPMQFHLRAQEDSALEWASALLLLAASLIIAIGLARDLAAMRRTGWRAWPLLLAALLVTGFFVLGMEEISWMQRIFGFGTPETLAEVNWQHEFNLHNIQTDLSETLYYVGSGIFLILLPLVGESLPAALAEHELWRFVPGREVAAIAAPLAIFTYGHWNLLPVQITSFLTLFVLLAFACAGFKRGNGKEGVLFLLLALAVAAGQALVLAYGPASTELPDASEYKEFFIAIGFAFYALAVCRRSGPASGRVRDRQIASRED